MQLAIDFSKSYSTPESAVFGQGESQVEVMQPQREADLCARLLELRVAYSDSDRDFLERSSIWTEILLLQAQLPVALVNQVAREAALAVMNAGNSQN